MSPGRKKEKYEELLNKISTEVVDSGIDVDEIKDHIKNIQTEVVDSGDDVDEIKEHIKTIKKEVVDSGDDVDEIKEDIDEIKDDIKSFRRNLFRRIKRTIPEKFEFDDLAQQIVGATIVSAPFVVTEEVWRLADNLNLARIIIIILITLTFDILLFYYTKYQKIKEVTKIGSITIPVRIISLLLVTYITSAIMLNVFGVIGGHINNDVWAVKLIILVGLFANIGAGTADLIK